MSGTPHVVRTIISKITIDSTPERVWDKITNVEIERFADPSLFRILDIPKPLRAEVVSTGEGGERIAYFSTGKRFMQKITAWKPYREYSFSFNPEYGFKVCYFFELSRGIFRIPTGAYFLESAGSSTDLRLETKYSIDRRFFILMNWPVRMILFAFQRYLLASIRKNCR